MPILTFGINHKTAPLVLREQMAFNPENMPNTLQQLLSKPAINEAVLISTCNRTEIYTAIDNPNILLDWFSQQNDAHPDNIKPFCYSYQGMHAVKHLMRVATGLDSMVLGEPQILGQIKQAYKIACDAGTVGNHLQQLFPAVFYASKEIRHQTNIGKNPVSLAFATVQQAKKIFSSLKKCTVLFVGAGETIELAASHFKKQDVKRIIIAGRNLNKTMLVAEQFGAEAIQIGAIPNHLNDVDIIVSATASQLPIIGKGMIERTLKHQKRRPLFMADLAMPRDIEPETADLEDVYLYNLDDLNMIIEKNLKNRSEAAIQAETLVSLQAEHYMRQLRITDASDMIRQYREQLGEIRDQELAKALQQLNNGNNPYEVLSTFAHSFTNKCLHKPTVKLRQAASDHQMELVMLAKYLFDL